MDNDRRKKVFVVLLIGIVLTSVAVANFASAPNARGGITESAVFANEHVAPIELNGTYSELVSITLPKIPMSGYYHVVGDGVVTTTPETAHFAVSLGVDSTSPDANTFRFYIVMTDIDQGYTGVHTEGIYHLGPGSHTFYVLGNAWQGTASADYTTIIVTFYTHGSTPQS